MNSPLHPLAIPTLAAGSAVGQVGASSGHGSNWVHPLLEERAAPGCGRGAFATSGIERGALLVVYGGRILGQEELESLSPEMQGYPYQVEEGLFLGPRDELDIGIGERLNHSCEPNAGFSGPIHVIALRAIQAGEQVTIDYATCVAGDIDAFRMECACGAESCRGTITGEDWRLPAVQRRLLGNFQPFLQRKAREQAALRRARCLRPLARLGRAVAAIAAWAVRFVSQSCREDWGAAVVSCMAAMASNLATCFIMEAAAPRILNLGVAQGAGQEIALIAAVTPLVGYATYLAAYYGGMVWRERRDFIRLGAVIPRAFRRKLKVIGCDLLAHLPSDLIVLPILGAAQGSLAVAGASQFWAIFWAQLLADCAYAWKEPLFWHGAKRFVAWRERAGSNVRP